MDRIDVRYGLGYFVAVAFAAVMATISGLLFGVFSWKWFCTMVLVAVVIRLMTTYWFRLRVDEGREQDG